MAATKRCPRAGCSAVFSGDDIYEAQGLVQAHAEAAHGPRAPKRPFKFFRSLRMEVSEP